MSALEKNGRGLPYSKTLARLPYPWPSCRRFGWLLPCAGCGGTAYIDFDVGFFTDSFRERVRASNDIVDVIGSYLPLKRAGGNFVALCPFHQEKSPSFNFSPSRQIYHCFGCHAGGDVFKFIQQYENLAFPEAVERLAERARIPLERDEHPGAVQARGLKDQLLKLHEAICQRWQHCLANEAAGQIARDYLARRGVGADAIKEFRLGAAPEAWDDAVGWLQKHGFESTLSEQAGLIIRKSDTAREYDRFRGRLMFPICDEQGRVIAFSGRMLQGDEKTAKYINSPETPIFTKGKVLFALDKAKRAILEAGFAIICEGQLDTIACHTAGVKNVVAPQGTALTADHARILKRYVNEVVLCFDGDKAGRAASVRSLDECLPSGLAVKVASIPPPDDPDSYLRHHGVEAFREILNRAQGFFDYYLAQLVAENDLGSDRGLLTVVRAMAEKVNRTGNAVLIDTYAQRTATRLGVTAEAVRTEFRKQVPAAPRLFRAANPSSPRIDNSDAASDASADAAAAESSIATLTGSTSKNFEPRETTRPGQPELWLLKFLLLADQNLLSWATAHLDCAWVSHETLRHVVGLRLSQAGSDRVGELAPLLDQLTEDPFAVQLVTEAALERRPVPDLEMQLAEATLRLRNLWIDRQLAVLTGQLTDAALSEAQRRDVMQRQVQLRTWRKAPLAELGGS